MRWLFFATCFFLVVITAFWIYVWNYRAEFVRSGLERACPHYHVSIGDVDVLDRKTCIIQHLSFQDDEDPTHLSILINELTLSTPTTSWLRWLLIPSKAPLFIDHATISFSNTAPFVLQPPQLYTDMHIDTLTAIWPDGTSTTFRNIHGSFSEILDKTLQFSAQSFHTKSSDS
jgi:hypothetical protein